MTLEPIQNMFTCPLCQNTEHQPIQLETKGGLPFGRWYVEKVRGFLARQLVDQQGTLQAMRCTNCRHVLLFAED